MICDDESVPTELAMDFSILVCQVSKGMDTFTYHVLSKNSNLVEDRRLLCLESEDFVFEGAKLCHQANHVVHLAIPRNLLTARGVVSNRVFRSTDLCFIV